MCRITARAIDGGIARGTDRTESERGALELFELLWRADFLAVDLSGTTRA